jgi:hypothetical protein
MRKTNRAIGKAHKKYKSFGKRSRKLKKPKAIVSYAFITKIHCLTITSAANAAKVIIFQADTTQSLENPLNYLLARFNHQPPPGG